MLATHRVKDKTGETLGFIIDNIFYTEKEVRHSIQYIKNLDLLSNGVLRAKQKLLDMEYSLVLEMIYREKCEKAPFKRNIQKDLEYWRKNGYLKVLQLGGSRQIGKTSELLKFAYKNYERVIYVNLVDDGGMFKNIMKKNSGNAFGMMKYCDINNLVQYKDSRDSILIIDEIQLDFEVYNMIRILRRNLNCDIIVTGSYMGKTLDKEFFLAAGTITYLTMYPLSFEEFCGAFGVGEILKHLDLQGGSSQGDYTTLFDLYELYKQIGGYPDVVREYQKSGSIDNCMDVVDDLLFTFKNESKRYVKDLHSVEAFNKAYEEIFRFMYNRKELDSGKDAVEEITNLLKKSSKEFLTREEALNTVYWFKFAGIVGFCDNQDDSAKKDYNRRVYFMDCGVANRISRSVGVKGPGLDGIFTEIFAFSELSRLCSARVGSKVVCENDPCFSKYNQYELDFLLTDNDYIRYGIEVKTKGGSGNKAHKSLDFFKNKGKIDVGVLAKETSGGIEGRFKTIPIYTVGVRFPYN